MVLIMEIKVFKNLVLHLQLLDLIYRVYTIFIGGVYSITTGTGMNGSGGMDASVTIDLDATQTTITSLKHNSLVIGEQNNTIDFSTDDTSYLILIILKNSK